MLLQELMPPYLDTLIMKLTGLLRNGQKIVQEGALTAMASVADCAKSHFVNYYSQARTQIYSLFRTTLIADLKELMLNLHQWLTALP